MTPQELKNSILQLAIQGKLVEQHTEEGTGEELYLKIQAEKQRLIKVGTIKKEKPLPEITEDEKPFDIPENWKWVRLGDIITLKSGQDMTPDKYISSNSGIPYITGASNFSNGSITIDRWTEVPQSIAYKGDLLITCKGTIGEMAFLGEEKAHIARQVMAIKEIGRIDIQFILIFLKWYVSDLKSMAKSMIPGINRDMVLSSIIPLPPFSEQKRIVAKIEELLPYIDRYEQAWSKLEDFNRRFPNDMQKSILQMAIQGKLVEQRSEEGTGEELYQQIQAEKQRLIKAGKNKKEKPLPEITEDEKPFDIPENWKLVRLSGIGITQTGNTPSKANPEYVGDEIPFITPGDILNGSICYSNQALSLLGKTVGRVCESNSILQVCIGGSIGKAAITKMDVAFNQQINVVSPMLCDSQYVYSVMTSQYFFGTMKEKAGGTATPIINRGIWDTLLIPLPPLAEQKRIVAKLEEILPLCEKLKK